MGRLAERGAKPLDIAGIEELPAFPLQTDPAGAVAGLFSTPKSEGKEG